MNRLQAASLCLLAVFAPPSKATAEEWGNLKGKVVIRFAQPPMIQPVQAGLNRQIPNEELLMADDGGLANVVIYVRTTGVSVHPDLASKVPPSVTIAVKDSTVRPRITTMWIGQQMVWLENSDTVSYNLNVQPLGDEPINPLLRPGDVAMYHPARQQSIPVPISCNIQPWIKAYLLPRSNPYVAVSTAKGEFKLEKLPARILDFQLWHERFGFLNTPQHPKGRFTLDLKPGDNDLGTILVER
jgi:hypothetical protein